MTENPSLGFTRTAISALGALLVGFFIEIGVVYWWRLLRPDQPIEGNDFLLITEPLNEIFGQCLVFLAILWLYKRPVPQYLGLTWPRITKAALPSFAASLGLAMIGVLYAATAVKSPSDFAELYQSAAKSGDLPLLWLTTGLLVPAGEEIVYRGFLFTGFVSSRLRIHGSVILTALLWVATHFFAGPTFLFYVFVLGIVLGYLRNATKSIIPTFMVHAGINIVVLFFSSQN